MTNNKKGSTHCLFINYTVKLISWNDSCCTPLLIKIDALSNFKDHMRINVLHNSNSTPTIKFNDNIDTLAFTNRITSGITQRATSECTTNSCNIRTRTATNFRTSNTADSSTSKCTNSAFTIRIHCDGI